MTGTLHNIKLDHDHVNRNFRVNLELVISEKEYQTYSNLQYGHTVSINDPVNDINAAVIGTNYLSVIAENTDGIKDYFMQHSGKTVSTVRFTPLTANLQRQAFFQQPIPNVRVELNLI